jgi:hypothetical protein
VFVIVVPFAAVAVATALAFSAGETDCQKPKTNARTKTLRINMGARSRNSSAKFRKDEMLIGDCILSPTITKITSLLGYSCMQLISL